MSHACAQWRGDIGAHIVGALDGPARDQVTRHLAACAGCRADYDELIPVRDWLALLAVTAAGPEPGPAGQLPDEVLLAGLGAGDAGLAIAFVRRFQRIVFGAALTVTGDPDTAEDVAQQTFERAWRHAQVYDSRRGPVRAWLTAIAHNLAVDVIRARTSVPVDPAELPVIITAVTGTPECFAAARDNAAGLRRALARLPAPQARAVAMAGIYGMTARQIADTDDIPLGTAKTRTRDGMQKLRAAYLPEDVGDE